MARPVSNLAQRLITAAVLIPILLAVIYLLPPIAFVGVVCAAAAAAAYEYYNIVAPKSRRLRIVGPIVSVALVAVVPHFADDARVWATVGAALPLLALLTFMFRPGDLTEATRLAGTFGLGLIYTGVLPIFVALLCTVPDHGPHLVFLMLSIAFLGDTGAYFTGRAVGRHKLYPALSPKKTWEGAVGGLIASAGGAAVAHFWYLPELPLVPGLILAAGAGAMGQAGDLCESMLKRAHGVKDSGRLLPGHGGMLDRIDGLLFAAPVLYIGLLWLGFVQLGGE